MDSQVSGRKPRSFWVISIIYWAYTALLLAFALSSWQEKRVEDFIFFLLVAATFVLFAVKPKWFLRFAGAGEEDTKS